MASISGITLKNVKDFEDHEGFLIHSGTICMDGKEIGSWADNYMAGPPEYRIKDADWKEIVKRADEFYNNFENSNAYKGDPEILISVLINLMEQEKMFDRCKADGYDTMIIIQGDYGRYKYLFVKGNHPNWQETFAKSIKEAEADFPAWVKPEVKYITSARDFVVDRNTPGVTW